MLNTLQKDQFDERGYVLLENVVSPDRIGQINAEIDRWVDQSRRHQSNFGRLIDGQPRFDMEPGHSATTPKLRRVTNPIEISDVIKDTLTQGNLPQSLVPILGEDIKFDHCKINAKHPGMKAEVKYHQDHIFEPQTNDSVVVALLMLNDTTVENGCLRVVPGSHHTRYSHSKNGVFTGTIEGAVCDEFDATADNIEAPAGSLCLMHTWAVHASSANASLNPRRLLITEYKAADAFPLTRHKLPSRYMDSIVLGKDAKAPRHREIQDFELPNFYEGDSLFHLQEMAAGEAGVLAAAG